MPKNEDRAGISMVKDDSVLIAENLSKAMQLKMGHDSDEYRTAAAELILTLINTVGDSTLNTNRLYQNDSGFFNGPKLTSLIKNDTSVSDFNNDIKKLRREFPALTFGKYLLLDKGNEHMVGFERILGPDTLLIIANLGNDVAAFSGHFQYSILPILLSNYELGPLPPLENSIALRPFEIKIYSVSHPHQN